jgi:DNA repair exonuclease SbcCD nuclease subunit
MERTKVNRKPTAILTSDWHLREDQPICRTDDYWRVQWQKITYIRGLQELYRCLVIHAGDLFDKWKPSPWLLRQAIIHLPNKFNTVYGQHDLPQHSLKLVNKCGTNVLEAGKHLAVLPECHWGQSVPEDGGMGFACVNPYYRSRVLVWHHLTYQHKPFPGATGGLAIGVLKKYPQYDLIVTGDNHKSFVEEYQGRLLVNPGSLMRMDADQINHKPSVYLWYAEDNTVQRVHLPIQENVISREHIDVKAQRDKRIDAFVSRLDDDWEAKMSFEDNLEIFFTTNKIDEKIKQIIYKSLETESHGN